MTAQSNQRRTPRWLMAGTAVLAGIALAGCSTPSSQPESGSAPSTSRATRDARPEPLVPDDFAAFIAEHPDVPLINVHTPYEGHIDGTDAFVPFDEILAWDDLPPNRSTTLAVYCRSGTMSRIATEQLASFGYTDVVDLAGGMRAWTDAGFEQLDQPPTTAGS